jgi:hypothetical protein
MNPKAKAVKLYRFPWYYSVAVPQPATKLVNRDQQVQDGASIKGKVIATIKKDSIVVVDLVENSLGWSRVISQRGCDPVPQAWINAQLDKVEADREGWLDNTSLTPLSDPPTTPTGKVKWIIAATITQVEE